MTVDVRRVLDERPDYLLSGYSHAPSDCVIQNVRRVNPGAPHRADVFTAAVHDLASGESRSIVVD